MPQPPDAPSTSTDCPLARLPRFSADMDVSATTGNEAASAAVSVFGVCAAVPHMISAYSAKLPVAKPNTESPTANFPPQLSACSPLLPPTALPTAYHQER